MKKNKTKYIKIRVSPDEVEMYKKKAEAYPTMTDYIRAALNEFSHVDTKRKVEMLNELLELLRQNRIELAHIGGNLNQAVKLANQLNKAGMLFPLSIDDIMTVIQDNRSVLDKIERKLTSLALKTSRQS